MDNVYVWDIPATAAVRLVCSVYIVTYPDGTQKQAYWTGQEARKAQRWLERRRNAKP